MKPPFADIHYSYSIYDNNCLLGATLLLFLNK
jgi:hypothetical protein